jgi:putative transposase
MRHTSFRFSLDPTPEQAALLSRHAGAYRFAYNQCLRLLTDALEAERADPLVPLPVRFALFSGFGSRGRGGPRPDRRATCGLPRGLSTPA